MYLRVPWNLKLKAVIATAYGAFALPLTSWAACTPPSPMGAANGSVLCSGTNTGQYLINAANVQFTNDSTGDMTLSGTSIGLVYARENTANGVSVINQGKMTWNGALFQAPSGGGRALANIGYLNTNNFSRASFTNASGASLTMTTASAALTNSGLDTVAVAASAANSQATVVNDGSISLTNTATGTSVSNNAIEILAQNFTVTNTGTVDVTSSASAFTSGLQPRMWSATTGGSGSTTNSGQITISNTHATRITGSVGIYQQAVINSLVENSGSIALTNSSPAAASAVGGIGVAGYSNSSGFARINNTGSVVVDSPSNYVYAAQSGAYSNANPMTIVNSGLLEIKSSTPIPDAIFRAAVMVLPGSSGLTALQTINNTASGIIRADAQSYAVVVYENVPVHLNNGGTITGNVYLGEGADELDHTGGTITGNINLGIGNDTMRASGGALVGITSMDAGDDTLTLAAGLNVSQAPQFDGGSGTDTLTVDGLAMRGFTGSNNLANGNNLTLWETIHLANAATLQLSGPLFESSAAAQINIDSAATLRASDAQGTFNVYGSVANDGTITLADASPAADDRLTFTGNFTGAGSNLVVLDTVLGDSSSASDLLEINGNTTGVSTLRIVNANGLGAATTGDGILVIKVDGASNGVFALEGGSITAGHFSYTLHQVGNSWYLQSLLLAPSISVACNPVELFDSANQVSSCTLTLTHPAPAQGLSVNLNLPAANPRYSTTCTHPILVSAGALSATCTIVATPNTVANDGEATAELSIAPATVAGAYEVSGAPAQVRIKDDDKPSTASPAPVPTMGANSLLLLSLGLGGVGILFARGQRSKPKNR